MTKYTVTQSAVTQLLADVHSDKIAIPELQRPFVWDSVKVRDLMDSLYKGARTPRVRDVLRSLSVAGAQRRISVLHNATANADHPRESALAQFSR